MLLSKMMKVWEPTKAMRLPKNFAISRKSKVESQIVSTVETGPKENRGFECPKLSRNLPKFFLKIRFETPVQKYTVIFGIMENSGIFSLFSLFSGHIPLKPYIPKTHSKPS